MDVHITYETLFDILRKERSLDELQNLDIQFWAHVVTYLQERSTFMQKTSLAEQEKTRVQLSNIKRIIREIHDHRQRKLMNLAVNVVRTESASYIDKKNMLDDEKILFHELVGKLTAHRQEVLLQVMNNSLPLGMTAPSSKEETEEETKEETKEEAEVKTEEETETKSEESSEEEAPVETEGSPEDIMVKFISSVPKFLGKDKQVFGPFEEGTIVSLPEKIVEILLKKGKVQKVMKE